jgi:ParB family transcriptional regulator, chromosome partitioning protein
MSERTRQSGKRRFTVGDLFTDHRPQAVGVEDLPNAKEIRLDRIVADPGQPRRTFDETRLQELADSIRREGLLQPIAVRYDDDADCYVILHGERRWRAHQQLGLQTIAAIVREVPAERRLVQQLMENIVRDDLNAIDRAAALRALKTELGDAPWETVAEAVGIRRSRLFQLLGTEKLPDAARDDLRAGRMNEKQSRALQGLPAHQQDALRDAIVANDLPAAEAMRLSRRLREERPATAAQARRLLEEARSGGHSSAPRASAQSLLALIESANAGDRDSTAALRQALDRQAAPAFDSDRLERELSALALTLGAMSPTDRHAARTSLEALRNALGALLDA